MAYGVSTQWQDIHEKLGNYPKTEKPISQSVLQNKAVSKIEKLDERDMLDDIDDDELMRELMEDDAGDDHYMQAYKRDRMKQMEEARKGPQYGRIFTIDAKTYSREVKEVSNQSPVVLHLYQDFLKTCKLLNKHLAFIAQKYPSTKFCKSISTKTIPKFPDSNLPCLLLYKNGKLEHNVDHADKKVKLTQTQIEKFLAGFEMLPDYDFGSGSDDDEIETYKKMMRNNKGKGIQNAEDKQKQKDEQFQDDRPSDGRGYITLGMDDKKQKVE